MKYTAVLSIIALATTAAAMPTEVVEREVEIVARTGGGGGGGSNSQCNNDQTSVCCASLLGLTCLIDIIGGSCNGGSYCCDNGASTGGLININALNCVKVL